MDEFEFDVVRRTVYRFYANKKLPTLDMILEYLQANTDFPYKRTTLRNVLIKLEFKYKTLNKRIVLLESLRYQVWRNKYITTLREARREGRIIVYLDETWYDVIWMENGLSLSMLVLKMDGLKMLYCCERVQITTVNSQSLEKWY